jgi:predicted thioesterase
MGLVQPLLAEGETTVGVEVTLRHLAATPLGMRVRAHVVLESIDGRFLTFSAQVFDEKEKVGEGTHKRAIIRSQHFMARVREKSA